MKTMGAGEFKSRCLKIMDQVHRTREPVVITKRGKPVAKLVHADKRGDDIFGCLKGVFKIVGDIESPVVAPEEWEANRYPPYSPAKVGTRHIPLSKTIDGAHARRRRQAKRAGQ